VTDAEIQRLRELCLAMTPLLADEGVVMDEDEFWAVKGLDWDDAYCVAECENEGDARFIAAAREAMPKLLDEVEQNRAMLKREGNRCGRTGAVLGMAEEVLRLRELANEARQSIAALVTKTNNVFMERHFRTVLDKLEALSDHPPGKETL